jgi:hypothetical protein
MSKTNAERVANYRQRIKDGVEIPRCKCDRPLKGKLSQRRRMCRTCFTSSPDGKHRAWLRVNERRHRSVLQEYLKAWGSWKIGDKTTSPDGSAGVVDAIALYVNGSVTAEVQFEGDSESFLISSINPLISY